MTYRALHSEYNELINETEHEIRGYIVDRLHSVKNSRAEQHMDEIHGP